MSTDLKLRFRYNTLTGDVEVFEIEQESGLPAAEHDREHDRVAAEIGRLLDRDPRVSEVPGDLAPPVAPRVPAATETGEEEERRRHGPGPLRQDE
jgi:hypothetical protein